MKDQIPVFLHEIPFIKMLSQCLTAILPASSPIYQPSTLLQINHSYLHSGFISYTFLLHSWKQIKKCIILYLFPETARLAETALPEVERNKSDERDEG